MSGSTLHVLDANEPPAERRVQFGMRLSPEHKAAFTKAARECGLDPAVAARCLIELVLLHIDRGDDLLTILRDFKRSAESALPSKAED